MWVGGGSVRFPLALRHIHLCRSRVFRRAVYIRLHLGKAFRRRVAGTIRHRSYIVPRRAVLMVRAFNVPTLAYQRGAALWWLRVVQILRLDVGPAIGGASLAKVAGGKFGDVMLWCHRSSRVGRRA